MTPDELRELWAAGPAAFTRLVSPIYAMAPDNPFELQVTVRRQAPPVDRRPRATPVTLDDLPLDVALALCLWYTARAQAPETPHAA